MKLVTSSFVLSGISMAAACGLVAGAIACSSGGTPGSSSGQVDPDAASGDDASIVETDSATVADSKTTNDSGGYPHRYGTSDVDGACEFNRDCKEGLRCECLKGDCACKVGVRGEGGVGAPCTTNEACGSAVCFDDRLCTDECETNATCKGEIPNCKTLIGFSAKICLP